MNTGTSSKAKKRFKNIIATNKSDMNQTLFSWDSNKEFSLTFHDKAFSAVLYNSFIFTN